MPRYRGIPIPQMSHHLTLKPKGEAKETKAGRGWLAQRHIASKQQNADSNLDLSSGVTVASQRERAEVTLFLISDEAEWKKKI